MYSLMCFYPSTLYFGNSLHFDASVQVDMGFNMNILDIGGGFIGSEFQLRQVSSEQLWLDFWAETCNHLVCTWSFHCEKLLQYCKICFAQFYSSWLQTVPETWAVFSFIILFLTQNSLGHAICLRLAITESLKEVLNRVYCNGITLK